MSSRITQGETISVTKNPITYIKAVPLKNPDELTKLKDEIKNGNILIVKITPLAMKSIEQVKGAIDELKTYCESMGGDIARLGEERIVLTPQHIKIWRKKTA